MEYRLSNPEFAILSLISEQPRHGYEIEQVIEERGMRNWTEVAFSSIYFLLNRLVKMKMAAFSLQPAEGRGPAKKVFHATDLGKTTLRDNVEQSIAELDPSGQRFLLGLSCLPLLSHSEVQFAFESRISALAVKMAELEQNPALNLPYFPAHITAMFDYSLQQLHSELEWAQRFLDSYRKGNSQNG